MPINKKKYIVYFFTFFFIGNILYYYQYKEVLKRFLQFSDEKSLKTNESDGGDIKVKIKGCVRNPGIYTLPQGSKLGDLIYTSHGLLKDADKRQINFNLLLKDGKEYFICYRKLRKGEYININEAGMEELYRIPEMKKGIAKAIIMYRNKYKKFDEIAELKEIKGIGEKRFNHIKNFIHIGE